MEPLTTRHAAVFDPIRCILISVLIALTMSRCGCDRAPAEAIAAAGLRKGRQHQQRAECVPARAAEPCVRRPCPLLRTLARLRKGHERYDENG